MSEPTFPPDAAGRGRPWRAPHPAALATPPPDLSSALLLVAFQVTEARPSCGPMVAVHLFSPRRVVVGLAGCVLAATMATPPAAGAPAASAFLQEHAKDRVTWEAWGEAAFQRAKTENRPLYVHVGFFTNELSRAMDRQSFANADAAKYLNDNFVCVLVDRDQQPEIAALFRAYLHDVKQLDGWPLNLWLTPELKPIEGATYLPPSEEWGKPGLNNVAKQVAGAWQADAAAQRQKAAEALTALANAEKPTAPNPGDATARQHATSYNLDAWKAKFDATNGGFGDPPKRLEPELLRALLRDTATRDLALTTLRAMADGAIRDPLDGGFFHQSIDAAWRVPYLQKLASDQARIALAFLDAAKLDHDPRFAAAARGALQFAATELRDGAHGFIGGEDASREAQGYYFWTVADVTAAVGPAHAAAVAQALGIDEKGNIPDDAYSSVTTAQKSIPYRAKPFDPATDAADSELRGKLAAARAQRGTLRRDTAAPAAVQGLLLQALSSAAVELHDAKLRTAAEQTLAYVRGTLIAPDASLRRIAGSTTAAAPADYASVIAGLHAYAANLGDKAATTVANALQTRLDRDYFDATAGRYFAVPATGKAGWPRVHVPTPLPGESPAPETTMLALLRAEHAPSDELNVRENALLAEAKDATDDARGDLLLALMK